MTNRKLDSGCFSLAVLFTVPAFSKAKPKPGDAILRGKIGSGEGDTFNPVPDKRCGPRFLPRSKETQMASFV